MSTEPGERQELIQTAVEFLLNPRVRDFSPVEQSDYLKQRGLTNEEIDIAKTTTEQLTRQKLSQWTEMASTTSLFNLPFKGLLFKGFLALGVAYTTCVALRHQITRSANQWMEDLPVIRELKETKTLMQNMQQSQRDYCSRVKELMNANAKEIARLREESAEKDRLYRKETEHILLRCKALEAAQEKQTQQLQELLSGQSGPQTANGDGVRDNGVESGMSGRSRSTRSDGQSLPMGSPSGAHSHPLDHQERKPQAVFSCVSLHAKPGSGNFSDMSCNDIERQESIPRFWLTSRAAAGFAMADGFKDESTEFESVQEIPDPIEIPTSGRHKRTSSF